MGVIERCGCGVVCVGVTLDSRCWWRVVDGGGGGGWCVLDVNQIF